MTATAPVLPTLQSLPSLDEFADRAMARIDEAMLHICLLGDLLTSEQRHPIRNDLAAAISAVSTLRRLYGESTHDA